MFRSRHSPCNIFNTTSIICWSDASRPWRQKEEVWRHRETATEQVHSSICIMYQECDHEWTELTGAPWMPGMPGTPRSPLSPLGPGSPDGPWSPGLPGSPVGPLCPVSPLIPCCKDRSSKTWFLSEWMIFKVKKNWGKKERRKHMKERIIFMKHWSDFCVGKPYLSFGSRFTRQTLSQQTQRLCHCHIHHFHPSFLPQRHSLGSNSRMNLVNECLKMLLQRANVHHCFTVM